MSRFKQKMTLEQAKPTTSSSQSQPKAGAFQHRLLRLANEIYALANDIKQTIPREQHPNLRTTLYHALAWEEVYMNTGLFEARLMAGLAKAHDEMTILAEWEEEDREFNLKLAKTRPGFAGHDGGGKVDLRFQKEGL